jgi:dolichyl-diphosphooligosaccharide--protein glycosyltransferase
MPVAILVPIALSFISRFMAGRAWKPVYYPLVVLGLLGVGLAALHAVNPSLFQYMLSQFGIFTPGGASLTIMEVEPLLFPGGEFGFQTAWANFTTSFFIAFISFAMLAYVLVKERSADKTLFLLWSIIILVAILGQRRFGYYYAVNVALLTGYFSWKMLDIAGLSKLLAKSKEAVTIVKKFKKREKKAREKAKPKTFMQPRGAWIRVIVVGIAIFFLVFYPNIGKVEVLAGQQYIMTRGWYNSMLWLKDNSPEPFGDPNFYYEIDPTRDEFEYPETVYGVMSWWDYGYFIMQIAHRIPNANPMQAGAPVAGKFFTAQNETSANEIADELGTKYVVIDNAMPTTKFYAMVQWAGGNLSKFYDFYYQPTQDGGQWGMLYHPAYYNSTVVRLYNFDGKAVTPTESIVISYEDSPAGGGETYKEITNGWSFPTYEEAEAFVGNQTSGNYRIVGINPSSSPVPLEELNSYERFYPTGNTTTAGTIKIFKYLG